MAQQESCTLDRLDEALRQLSTELEESKLSGFAFISETVASSCAANIVETAAARGAVIEMCERLLAAIESSQPFDFNLPDSALLTLLFPEKSPGYSRKKHAATASAPASTAKSSNSAVSHESLQLSDQELELADRVEQCICTDEQLIREFLNESNEHLQVAEQLMLRLETHATDEATISDLFRAMHSLKGSAGVLELKSLGAISHLCEGVLVQVSDGQIALRDRVFEVFLFAVDAIAAQIKSLSACHAAKQPLVCPVASEVLIACLEQLNNHGECDQEALSLLKRSQASEKQDTVTKSRKKSGAQLDSMRVDGKRLEQLIDLIGELVITDVMVQRELRSRDSLTANSVSSRLRKVVREVQQLSLTLKMVPIGTVLQKMKRMVRDLASQLNKQVDIQIFGADTEVDKTLLECIADPLVHLIRNSIDHGIESSIEERLAAGKPAVATIWIKAEHRSGCVHLQISDDGRGLNRPKILERAIERGLVDANAKLTDAEIDELIFTPGFSTANEVTEISGRGVGMDVVRQNIETMRGTVSLTSQTGRGTEINLELPLTLSIIDGTVIRIADRSFIIPTLSVVEQVQHSSLEFSGTADCRLVRFRSRYLPVKPLGEVLGTPHANSLKHGQVVMIVESGGKQHGLIVDEVLGQQPVVIKPLGGVLSGVTYFAGGALLSDGQVGFVLDLSAVCSKNS